ncbi:hypothetical protein PFISCL1PPCAC_26954, partial [Pristionchus fissidentatus]
AGSLTATIESGRGLTMPAIYQELNMDPRRPPPEDIYTFTEATSTVDEEKSTCLSWVKYGIFAANIVFIVVGTAIMAMGAWLRTDSRFRDFLSESNSTLLSIARSSQVNDTWYMWYNAVMDIIPGERRYRQVVEEAFWEAPTLYAFSYIMIVLGAFMIVVAFFGCCGVTAGVKPFIAIYAVAVFVLLIATLTAGLFIFYKKDGIDVEVQDALTYMVQHYYQGPSIVQESLDHLQQTFRCCGNAGCGDFRQFRQDPPRSCDIRCDGCHYRIMHALRIGFTASCVVFFFVILMQVVALSLACYLLFRPKQDVRVLYISDHANAAYQSSPPSTHPQPLSHLTRANLMRHNLPSALRKTQHRNR